MKVGAVFCPLNRTQNLNTFVEDIRVTEGRLLLVAPKFADTGRQLLAECITRRASYHGPGKSVQPPDIVQQRIALYECISRRCGWHSIVPCMLDINVES